MGNYHARCGAGEKPEVLAPEAYLSLFGKIPNFEKLISTIRSREISATIILQSLSQIISVYKDHAETIIDCCDSFVFLGGKSTKTAKSISEMIGKTTIDNREMSESRGSSGSYSMQNRTLGRDLIDPAEVGRIKRSECIVVISGEKPFRSPKYKLHKHKHYQLLAESKKTPSFDITKLDEAKDEAFLANVTEVVAVDLSELNVLV